MNKTLTSAVWQGLTSVVCGGQILKPWSLPPGARRTIGGFAWRPSRFGVSCNRKALAIAAADCAVVIFAAAGVERKRINLKAEPAPLAFSADWAILATATIYNTGAGVGCRAMDRNHKLWKFQGNQDFV